MKRLLFVALFFVSGCSLTDEMIAPSKTIRNPACRDIDVVDVSQVFDNFILGDVCEEYSHYSWGERYCKYENRHGVYLQKENEKIYYDNQKIKVEPGKCVAYTGTYTHKLWSGSETVPKVKIIDSEIPNPEYQTWEKRQAEKKK